MNLLDFRLTSVRAGFALVALSVAACTLPAAHAEGPAAPSTADGKPAASIFTMPVSVTSPTADYLYQPAGVSSSEDAIADANPAAGLDAARDNLSYDGAQPPPGRRRSYGRSRYQDRLHNADGSTKIAFMAGAGINVPVGNTGKYYTPHLDIGVGAGINFNKTFGILGEFRYDRMGLTAGSINTQYANYLLDGATSDELAGLDANAHTLSITVDPVVNFQAAHSRMGAYVTGGFGYYHKTTNFTLPTQVGGCFDFFCQTYIQNQTFDQYSAGGFGANVGFGLTYKLSEFSSERLFMEARYQWMNLKSDNNTDEFQFNRRNTETLPITVGVRF